MIVLSSDSAAPRSLWLASTAESPSAVLHVSLTRQSHSVRQPRKVSRRRSISNVSLASSNSSSKSRVQQKSGCEAPVARTRVSDTWWRAVAVVRGHGLQPAASGSSCTRHAPAHMMIMTIHGNCSVNDTPSLVHVVACAAGAVAVPIQTAPPSRTPSTPPASPSRSGAAGTTADRAGDRGIFTEQGHRRRRWTSRSVPTAQFIYSAHHSLGTSRRDNSSTTTGNHGRITTRPWPPMPRPARRTDPRICPGRLIWMTYSAPTPFDPLESCPAIHAFNAL
jgi:hypothetical protein